MIQKLIKGLLAGLYGFSHPYIDRSQLLEQMVLPILKKSPVNHSGTEEFLKLRKYFPERSQQCTSETWVREDIWC